MTDLVLKTRLLSKMKIDEHSGCWNWTASLDTPGYGHMRYEGRVRLAHRLSYMVHKGPIEGLHICHKCDNRACINPAHLFAGNRSDNMRDMWSKKRHKPVKLTGETNPQSKLTEDDVRAIRAAVGVKQKDLAKKYGVDRAHISQIRSGGRWGHIT